MLNPPSAYFECGQKCAEARNQHDEARAQFHKNWFSRAKALESKLEDKVLAESEFNKGWLSVRRLTQY